MGKRKTHEEFIKEIYELYGDEFTILGTYINDHTKILVRHNRCGYERLITPNSLLRNKGCPKCYGNIKKDTKQFKEEVYKLCGEEYAVLGDYVNNRTKILLRHNKCGNEFLITPHSFLRGSRCLKCSIKENSDKQRKTQEEFVNEINNLYNNEYTILGKYINSGTKILVRHKKCGYEWETYPNHLLRGHRCPNCYGSKKKTTEQFKQDLYDKYGDEYTVLGEYINNKTEILIRHNKCGNEWYTKPNYILSGYQCPKCYGNIKKSTEQFKKEIYNLYGDEYEVLGEYHGNKRKILMKHNKCGCEWMVIPNNILRGSTCPVCNESKGENKITEWLRQNNINYIKEYKFEDCKHIRPLPFDFYLPDYNICIEYDGEQHFEPVDFSSKDYKKALRQFKLIQKRDEIKNNYCKSNNIKLIRIPYTQFDNIEDILQIEILNNNNNKEEFI